MAQPTLDVTDANNSKKTVNTLPPLGGTTKDSSLPTTLATDDPLVAATGAKTDAAYASADGSAAGGVISILKGLYASFGTKADAAYASSDGSAAGSFISVLKGAIVKLGSIVANQLSSVAFGGTASPLGAAAPYTGVSRDSGAPVGSPGIYAYFNGFFLADQAGTAFIDGSDDNATWSVVATTAAAAGAPVILTVPVLFRYHRIRFLNGSTAQSAFTAKSAYSGA